MERRIDRYRLLDEVGSGGMAVVHRGLDTLLGREVAIKVMHPHLAGREESRRRFSREARAVAKLRHPGIVEIWDFSGDDAAESFIVTEFVQGRTLRAFVEAVPPGLPEVGAMIADALADALAHAHANGVVHRDLKPENVMVSDAGALKVMDFGIARILEADEKMTMTGALVGSPLHMPPEVIEGRPADLRADVFSLGTLLYWLVTGREAFLARTTTLTLRQILEGTFDDPRLHAPACSDALADAIGRCLRRDPDERFASMGELRAALRQVLDEAGIDEPAGELRAFFADPPAYREALRVRLVGRLAAAGEAALVEGRTPRALSLFDRVLALDPGNEAVLAGLERIRRRQTRKDRLKRAGLAGLAAGTLAAVVLGGLALLPAAGDDVGPPAETAGAPAGPPDGAAAPGIPDGALAAAAGAETPGGATPAPGTAPEGEAAPGADGGTAGVGARSARADARAGGSDGEAPAPRPLLASADGDVPAEASRPAPPRPEPARVQRRVTIAWSPPGPGVHLHVDDAPRDTEQAPFWEGPLPVGEHVIAVARPDCCEPERQTIVVPPGDGELPPFRIALRPKPAWLVVRSGRDDVAVSVDGEPKGLLRAFPGGRIPVTLASGSQRVYRREVEVALALADGRRTSRTVELRAGQETAVEVDLE